MNQNSDEKLAEFLRQNKPIPSLPNPRESSIIWAKISILNLNKRSKWLSKKLVMNLSLMMAILFFGKIIFMPKPESILAEIEQSFELDTDREELNEVTDLISLVQ